eukprot:jgi/Pico_ML_1/53856/g4327.t1
MTMLLQTTLILKQKKNSSYQMIWHSTATKTVVMEMEKRIPLRVKRKILTKEIQMRL